MRLLAIALLLSMAASCSPTVNPNPQAQTFDVGNSSSAPCPGGLYDQATQGLANCSQPPETCVSPMGASVIRCDCTGGGDGGLGTWNCHQDTASTDAGSGG